MVVIPVNTREVMPSIWWLPNVIAATSQTPREPLKRQDPGLLLGDSDSLVLGGASKSACWTSPTVIMAWSWMWEPKNKFILTTAAENVSADWHSTDQVEEWWGFFVAFFC